MIRRCADLEEASRLALDEVVATAARSITARGRFFVALGGGSTPRSLYRLLASPGHAGQVDWSRTEIFFGDERAVSPGDPESNHGMARALLIDPLGIDGAKVHRMPADAPDLAKAATVYADEMGRTFGIPHPGAPPRFDLVLLGLGADAHTASLFPRQPALAETTAWVATARSPLPPTDRLTLTPPVLQAARRVVFTVVGASKAEAVKAALEGPHDPTEVPAQIVTGEDAGEDARVLWLLDEGAASKLTARRP